MIEDRLTAIKRRDAFSVEQSDAAHDRRWLLLALEEAEGEAARHYITAQEWREKWRIAIQHAGDNNHRAESSERERDEAKELLRMCQVDLRGGTYRGILHDRVAAFLASLSPQP